MFMLRSGMEIIKRLKAKFAGRKAAKSKLTFKAWCKANGHTASQSTVGGLMQAFIAQVKPSKADVRDAVGHVFAESVKASVPPSLDSAALDAVTAASALAGSHEAIALRASLSLEPELPPHLEADVDRASELINSGRQREGLALLKSALAQVQPTLPAAKASGNPISAPSKTAQPTHSQKAERAVDGAKLSAPSAKASKPATASKPTAAGVVQLSDRPTNSSEANRKERVRRLLADAGLPLKSLEGVWWSADGEKSLRSSRDILKRQLEGVKSWREREPLELLILETLQGKHQPVDLFRRFRFLADDKDGRTILR